MRSTILAFGLILASTAQLAAQPPAAQPPTLPPPTAQSPAIAPAQNGPHSACAASAAATAAATDWECPTCHHHGACPTCGQGGEFPGVNRVMNWMFYRPCKVDKSCQKCCEPCHPPLYAWFPCANGCGSCSTCGTGAGGCASGTCSTGRSGGGVRPGVFLGKGDKCAGGKGHCKNCGEFRFAYCGPERFLYSDGTCGHNEAGVAAQPATQTAAPAAPATTPAPPPADQQARQSVSYKQDADAVAGSVVPPKAPVNRYPTTYRPDSVKQQMPVLSPDQFRKQQ